MHPMPIDTLILLGGGTGGHLFPALAVAEEARDLLPAPPRVYVICSTRPVDAGILHAAKASGLVTDFAPLRAQPLSASPLALARFVASWPAAVGRARALIRGWSAGRTAAALATGGFVAGPAARAAHKEGVPLTLLNMDAVAGRASRWISTFAARTFTVSTAASASVPPGWHAVPPVVRREALPGPGASPQAARRALGLAADAPTLLVTGASQGARSVNDFLAAFLGPHADALRAPGWQVLHQCGEGAEPALRDAYARAGVPAVVTAFVRDMASAWLAADLAIARAGAGTVGEVWASGTPTLFMPYPYHKDNHQRKNAEPLADLGGVLILHDHVDAGANLRSHAATLRLLLGDASARAAMAQQLRTLGPADGAKRVASQMLADTGRRG